MLSVFLVNDFHLHVGGATFFFSHVNTPPPPFPNKEKTSLAGRREGGLISVHAFCDCAKIGAEFTLS